MGNFLEEGKFSALNRYSLFRYSMMHIRTVTNKTTIPSGLFKRDITAIKSKRVYRFKYVYC